VVAPVRFQLDRRRRAGLRLSRDFHLHAVVGSGKISLCAYGQGRYEQSYGTQEEGPSRIAKSLRIDSHHSPAPKRCRTRGPEGLRQPTPSTYYVDQCKPHARE
jgi:hypothetical protein